MSLSMKSLVAGATLFVAAAAIAQSGVGGAWKGKVQLDESKLPKVTDPKQKEMMNKIIAGVKKMTLHLDLKSNKTFTLKASDVPVPPNGQKPKNDTAEGTWSQKGSVITLKFTKTAGMNPQGGNQPQDLKVLDGGKKLEMIPKTPTGAANGKIIFTR